MPRKKSKTNPQAKVQTQTAAELSQQLIDLRLELDNAPALHNNEQVVDVPPTLFGQHQLPAVPSFFGRKLKQKEQNIEDRLELVEMLQEIEAVKAQIAQYAQRLQELDEEKKELLISVDFYNSWLIRVTEMQRTQAILSQPECVEFLAHMESLTVNPNAATGEQELLASLESYIDDMQEDDNQMGLQLS